MILASIGLRLHGSRLPRGRRGLKYRLPDEVARSHGSPPAREAWIEMMVTYCVESQRGVASREGGGD